MHLVINFEIGHCASALNPVIVQIEGDKEAQARGGYDSEISSIIGKSSVRFLLIFFGDTIKYFRLEVIVSITHKCNRHVIELGDFLPICYR